MGAHGQPSLAIEATDLHRRFGDLHVLKGVSVRIEAGRMVSIVGKSGSGKSTLLHILGTLDKPDSGKLQVGGTDVFALSPTALAAWRNARLGFVFQFHHLLPEFTALENVAIPAMIAGMPRKAALRQASTLLDFLQLTPRADHKPGQLSGGEQQRVAIGRALMNAPDILLADEPTGNLDTETSAQVHQLLRRITTDMGKTLVVVTHNPELAGLSDIVFEMRDGLLLEPTGE
jgi:lipoprotein-releasing system ATP-binding protein